MSKFLLNLLLQISKALVNSKNPIFNSKILFLLILARPTLRPTQPLSPASPLVAPSLAGRKRPTGLSSPRVGHVLAGNTFSFSDHAFLSQSPPPSVTATRAPLVSFIVSPTPADPGWNLPRAVASRLGCPRAFTALPHHFPLLTPSTRALTALKAFNGVKDINTGINRPGHPPRCSSGPYKR
jgi:hypothetical protein